MDSGKKIDICSQCGLMRMKTKCHSKIMASILTISGTVASWLVGSSPDRAVWVRALARNIVLCSWARHFTLTVPLSSQVYKWVPANLMLGITLRWTSVEILVVATWYGNREKLPCLMGHLARMQTSPTYSYDHWRRHNIPKYIWRFY